MVPGVNGSLAERRWGKSEKQKYPFGPSSLLVGSHSTESTRSLRPASPRRRFRRLRHLPRRPPPRARIVWNAHPSGSPCRFASSMGLDRYRSSRVIFSWQKRRVNKTKPKTSQKVLVQCKNQIGLGGKCSYMGICQALEAHKRLQTDEPCRELSWSELENKTTALKDVDERLGRVGKCLTVLKRTGIHYLDSKGKETEDIQKIKDFTRIDTKTAHSISQAVRKYMKEGPMVGTFYVYGNGFDWYGKSTAVDEIYVAYNPRVENIKIWSHVVAITEFGVQGSYPFWEFQNTYGPKWRGAARGFGQIYAVHVRFLYAFTLA